MEKAILTRLKKGTKAQFPITALIYNYPIVPEPKEENRITKGIQERLDKRKQEQPHELQQPKVDYFTLSEEEKRGFPKREDPGMIFCPKRLSSLATMRCGEYQEEGCTCGVQATSQEIEWAKLSMQWKDRSLPTEVSQEEEE